MPKQRLTVVYIMGCGHSGSTLLDMILGAHPELVGCGELKRFPDTDSSSWRQCACGDVVKSCSFWSRVYEHWHRQVPGVELSDLLFAAKRLERLRTLPRSMVTLKKTANFSVYARGMEAMYRAIAAVSGQSVVVDSSKHPIRALLLANLPGIDLRLVHLVRDGRAVSWSVLNSKVRKGESRWQTKGMRRNLMLARAGFGWALMNSAADWVRNGLSVPSCRVRYERLVAEPMITLTTVGRALRLDVSPPIETTIERMPIPPSHVIAGNRMRKSGVSRIRMEQKWVSEMNKNDQRLVWGTIWPFAHRYGYRWAGKRDQSGNAI